MQTKLYIEHPAPRTRCFICRLLPGDRFYFVSDKTRIVWEVQQSEQKKTWKHEGHTWTAGINVKNDIGQVKYCLNKTEVVFLRKS